MLETGPAVFLSYRRDDASGHAGRLYDALSAALGVDRVFFDVVSIAPGRDFMDVLTTSLDRSSVLVAVIGPDWLNTTDGHGRRRLDDPDDIVRRELELGLALGVRVIPVLVGGSVMPSEGELPASLVPLARAQAVELSDRLWRPSLRALLDAMDDAHRQPASRDASVVGRAKAASNNLPNPPTPMVGRDHDVELIADAFREYRCVTLVGAGGVGKTRLALEVACEFLDRFADGVWLVELASIADPGLLAPTVATVLGVGPEPGSGPKERLIDVLADRETLLVLDNCEHLLDVIAELTSGLLVACPRLRVLATSREALRIPQESAYRVPSLPFPPDGAEVSEIERFESVQLFAARAKQVDARFSLDQVDPTIVARVCRRLDGIPLAIELAAAHVRSLTLDDLSSRLDDRFQILTGGTRTALARQQTFRALIDWSYDLLTDAERSVLARLSVFAGGWTLDAAEGVIVGDDLETIDILTSISALVDKSMVEFDGVSGPGRYRLLGAVQEYAAERLADGDAAARFRAVHRDYFLALAEATAPGLIGPEVAEGLARLDLDYDNLRAAIATSIEDADAAPGLRLGIALREYWRTRDDWAQSIAYLTLLLERPVDDPSTHLHAMTLIIIADRLFEVDAEAARTSYEAALVIARRSDDDLAIAEAIRGLAWMRGWEDPTAALDLNTEARQHAALAGDQHLMAGLISQRALLLADCHDVDAARSAFDESLRLARELGYQSLIASTLNNRGTIECEQGDLEAADVNYHEALAINRELRYESFTALCLANLASNAWRRAEFDAANEFLRQAAPTAQRVGSRYLCGHIAAGAALIATARGELHQAALLHGAASALRADTGWEASEARARDRDYENLEARMGRTDFLVALEEGRRLTRDEATSLALSLLAAQHAVS